MGKPETRPGWVVTIFVLLQVGIPTIGLALRWVGVLEYARFSWHMFSVAP